MLAMLEMPWTTVQKITGAIIMRISAMNPSPSGFIAASIATFNL